MSYADDIQDLRGAVLVMRELGVTRWRDIELGAVPVPPTTETTQQPTDPQETERRRREQISIVARSASSGLLRRLGED